MLAVGLLIYNWKKIQTFSFPLYRGFTDQHAVQYPECRICLQPGTPPAIWLQINILGNNFLGNLVKFNV